MELRALSRTGSLVGLAAECYRAAHETSDPLKDVAARFERHATYPGWRGFVALADLDDAGTGSVEGTSRVEGTSNAGTNRFDGTKDVVGYVYGYSSAADQRYHRQLRRSLPHHLSARWLTDCFELVELGVHPAHRRRGVATALHDAVLDGVEHNTAVLTTGVHNDAALALYTALDWVHLWEPFRFEGGSPMTVLGKRL